MYVEFDGQEEAFYPSDNEHMPEYEAGWGAQGDFGHRPNSTFRSSSKQRTIKPFEARLAQQLSSSHSAFGLCCAVGCDDSAGGL
jgi:hypothetical protein